MRANSSLLWFTLMAAGLFCLTAQAANWTSVADGSSLEFIARYEGTEAPGRFEQFNVDLVFSPELTAGTSIRVEVSTASARLGSEELDEAVKTPEWFDAETFPLAVFISNGIVRSGASDYIASGVLSIKGVSKNIEVPLHWSSDSRQAEISGELSLSRLDFGIGSGEWSKDQTIGFDVNVRFRIKLESGP